ncbi:isochorismatase family protein [uncultured Pigmentiphaga sp.]|jgi:Amidases related to nicotinamidase|uniref:isochorismatase family protein n=1 Tax=uncultured Pigmentiphaga sp. TaxID=340361 RepID=UPI002601EC28|nr:isochorismatase family protein [uncultured Pigmentiphaga sp.]
MTVSQNRPRPWDGIIPEEEIAIYRKAGWGAPSGIGKRPALLVIDVQYRSMGYEPMPIMQAIDTMPTSCGEYGWRAVPQIARLLQTFRELGAPVLYPYVAPKKPHDQGQFERKVPGVMSVPLRDYDFVAQVQPISGEITIPKFQASAFQGTPLASYLVGLGVDTVVVTGCTTSGCVRATAVDACAMNLKVVVPEDAVYDRSQVSHAVNLFDMASKYADVLPTEELIPLLRQHRS